MKKLLVALLLLSSLFALPVAHAQTDCQQQICNLAQQNDKVVKAQCIVYKQNCLIALQTEGFASREEYCNFVGELCNTVKQRYDMQKVFVTRNPRVMQEIDRLASLSQEERDVTIQKIIQNEMEHRLPPLPIPRKG